ncbi:alpha-mannosidase [candidate division KSB1 bacterium]|nr:alpha-mannosidase [candidate division KSB1 bacterium]
MNQKLKNLYARRIELFQQRIAKCILKESIIFNARYSTSDQPVLFEDRLHGKFKPGKEGDTWGKTWQSAWFHLTATVPKDWKDECVVAQLEFAGEGLVCQTNGYPIAGISGGSVFEPDYHREFVWLFPKCTGGEDVELWVETAANGLFGVVQELDPPRQSPERFGHYEGKINKIRLCQFDEQLWHLWLDIDVLSGVMKSQPDNSVRQLRILRHLNKMIEIFADNAEHSTQCREYLQEKLSQPATPSELQTTAVGHAHIDTGWLWPVQESIRKCARTFANQITLLRKYPDYIFGASQPQHYAFTKMHYPELYHEIKQAVQSGKWELQGGMWVEADCNLISGESMIRQILHGKNFFRDEFGIEVKNLWLPDVFGYSAAIPQILKKSGIDYFLTQKISWNQFNAFPHHTFLWRGIDGSEVLTHFPPEDTYNSNLHSHSLAKARDRFAEKDVLDEFICLFGVGDGGGGPTEKQIERGKRQENLEGSPRLSFGTADAFFERLQKNISELETWVGELYLELHRGTLTTQALVKKRNRQLEHKLRQLEILWTCLPFENYPSEQLDQLWKKVLINQFHDILPGSSINKVYQVTHAEHEQVLQSCKNLEKKAVVRLFENDEDSLVLFNSTATHFQGSIQLPETWQGFEAIEQASGQKLVQQLEDQLLVALVSVPALSFLTVRKGESRPNSISSHTTHDFTLENEFIRYKFNDDGALQSAFDKEIGREMLVGDKAGNLLTLYEDRPNDWDAWDVDLFYENSIIEHARPVEIKRIASGPVRQGLELQSQIGCSKIWQKIYLHPHSKRLDFETKVDWHESHRMLRVSFQVNVTADHAKFDIQYGHVERPTHRNTSWDMAKFEVVGHRYADLSQPDFGVALLNDCKYGYKVFDKTLDLNLLRSPRHPDPDADKGLHTFTYSLLPHKNDLIHSAVIAEATQLNQGLAAFYGFKQKQQTGLPFKLVGEGFELGALKKAEKSDDYIIRIVERLGRRTHCKLELQFGTMEIYETDLLEWHKIKDLPADQSIELELIPFEIKTLKFKR